MSHDLETPAAPVVSTTQAGALIRAERYTEAISLITNALTQHPGDAELHYLLGTAHYRTGDAQPAWQAFAAATRIDPSHAFAHYGLGLICKDHRDTDGAIQHFRDALGADPHLAAARSQLAELQPQTSAAVGDPTPQDGHSLAELLDERERPRLDEEAMAGAVVWSGRPAVRSMAGSLIFAAVLLLLPGFLSETAEGMAPSVARDGIAALWRLAEAASWPAAVALVVTGWVRMGTRRYVLREHRAEVFAGLINRQHITVWLHDVERPVIVNQNLWQLALGLGNVDLHSTVLPAPRGRRHVGRPGTLLLSGLPIGVAEDAAGFLRTAVLWERRRMVLTFVSAR